MSRTDTAAVKFEPHRTGALTGRDGELARLTSQFEEGRDARAFRVAFVRGPAGVGRSALVGELCARLESRGVTVLRGSAPRVGAVPYGLLRELVPAALAHLRPTLPAAALRSLEDRLAPIFGRAAPAGAAPLDLSAALADVLQRAARDEAIAIVVDDADAADPASLAVLSYVVATLVAPGAVRAADEPVAGGLLAVSLRDESVPAALADLQARTPALSIPLVALDLEGLRAYLTRSGAAERLFEATGGVPGRLEELLAPGGAIDFAARRFERLPSADRDVLAALALLGHPADAELAALVSARRDAAQRLPKLAQAGLVQQSPGAGRTLFQLARDADRRALLGALSAQDRRALHLSAGAALEGRGDVEEAFRHYAEAGDAEKAAPAGLSAADRLVARLAFDAAEEVLARVSALALPAPLRAKALLALVPVLEQKADVRGALAALGRARSILPASEGRALRARAARLCIQVGAARPAERLARAVLAAGEGDAAAADAAVALAEARFLRGAYEEALAAAARADVPARERLLLANVRGKALLTLGRLDEAKAAFRENAVVAEHANEPAERARALLNVGVTAHRQGDRREARAAYRDAIAHGNGPFAAIAHANLSSLLLEEGEAEEALAQAHRALAAFARAGRAKEQAHAAQNLARVYLYLGDLARADEVASHAAHLAARVGDPYVGAGASLVQAEVLLARADAAAAPALEAVAQSFETLKSPRYLRSALVLLAEARVQEARVAEARAALARARAAGALEQPLFAAEYHLLDAELALGAGDEPAASASLSAARDALLADPQLELPARLYWLQGQLAERRGEVERAQADRLKAAHILDELAARIPPDRRPLFFSRRRRRVVLDAAGRALLELPRPSASPLPVAPGGEGTTTIIGRSASIGRVKSLLDRVGPSTATVLVRGESGTGKELVARALHEKSPRRHLPLVAVNCGALNEELLLSELFGHEKGSFTGAIKERKGRFELADGGTIFLDEIGDISPRAQVALLRVLQERTFERVGGSRTIKVDVRVVCATNRNLEALMARGEFREDLYYRLRGATLTLPPLRERPEDIAALSEHLLARLAADRGETPRALAPEALRLLQRYRWPGNIRELHNVLESAALLATGPTLGPEAFELFPELFAEPVASPAAAAPAEAPVAAASRLAPTPATDAIVAVVPAPAPVAAPSAAAPIAAGPVDYYALLRASGVTLRDLRHDLEVQCIAAALGEGSGNISEAARLLGMKRSRLSQIVNAEPSLRALCKGADAAVGPAADEDDE